jgi:hypothetical protein
MSDTTATSPRPVSLFTIIFVLALFAAFFFVVRYFYAPAETAPQNAAAEQLPKDLEWKATAASRRTTLNELREQQAQQVSSYGWVDQQAGVVRLPIERAMELVVQDAKAKQQSAPAPQKRL